MKMRFSLQSVTAAGGFALLALFLLLPQHAHAQLGEIREDRRIDIGYKMRGYAYSFTPNLNYGGGHPVIRKGFVTASYKRYLTDHLFWNFGAAYLMHNNRTSFLGGPINFNAGELGSSIGVRWGSVSLYTGLSGGVNWNYKIRYQSQGAGFQYYGAASPDRSIYGSIRTGIKVHLLSFVTIESEIRNTQYRENDIRPLHIRDRAPSVYKASFAEFSASIGVSIGIPWKTGGDDPDRPTHPTSPTHSPRPTPKQGETTEETAERPPPVTRPPASAPAPLDFQNPLGSDHLLTSPWGDGRGHEGWDLNLNVGDTVKAAMSGVVTRTSWFGAYGNMIEIKHPAGYSTRYAHLNKILVKKQQKVDIGDPIGLGGNTGRSTGPHLHFELRRYNFPINPRPFIEIDWSRHRESGFGGP